MLRSAINRATEAGVRIAESNPYVWKIAWEAVHRLPFLLPHDKSYKALRHFIAIEPNGLFLDVGANDGISALSFRKFSKDYRIFSVEPNPLLEPSLKKIKAADLLFDYRILAAGASAGRATFFVPAYGNIVLHTCASVSRQHVLDAVRQSFGAGVASSVKVESFDSDIIALDQLALTPAIIKIDAEGFNYATLQGMYGTVGRARPFIMFEIDRAEYAEVSDYFHRQDYLVLGYNLIGDRFIRGFTSLDQVVNETSGHRNVFAVPREKSNLLPLG